MHRNGQVARGIGSQPVKDPGFQPGQHQVRLQLSSFAFLMMQVLRGQVLSGTRMARARRDTIHRDLLKIGARVGVSVHRVRLHCSDSHRGRRPFAEAADRIRDIPGGPGPSRKPKQGHTPRNCPAEMGLDRALGQKYVHLHGE